jgi:hypothetical protein
MRAELPMKLRDGELVYFDRQGNEISLERFDQLHSTNEYRFVAKDLVSGIWRGAETNVAVVITIWTGGLDSDLSDPPFLFETTAFVRIGETPWTEGMRLTDDPEAYFHSTDEINVRQYFDEKAAMLGHAEVLAEAQQYVLNQQILKRSQS